jgi:hypothetical protein
VKIIRLAMVSLAPSRLIFCMIYNRLQLLLLLVPGGVVCVSIPAQTSTLQLKYQVYRKLNLVHIVDEEKIVFKLRDPTGALVPLSNQLESNDSSWYYLFGL